MDISYKKLWKLLIDRDMKKKDLEKAAGISNYVISKMTRNENITVETVGKICKVLNCTPNDMMEFVSDSEHISANVKWGINKRMQNSAYACRFTLLCYRRNKDTKEIYIVPEKETVKKIFQRYLQGMSLD